MRAACAECYPMIVKPLNQTLALTALSAAIAALLIPSGASAAPAYEPIKHYQDGVEQCLAWQPGSADPVARANAHIVSVDNAGMAASDDTVDTDGKGLEARRDASPWQDNVISSNATLDNNVFVPPDGLVDLDSRPGGNVPLVATREGWCVAYHGTVDIKERNGSRAEQVFSLERVGNGYTHG